MSQNQKDVKAAVSTFRKDTYSLISKVSKFCSPKNVNFEILLCAIYVFSTASEGMLFDIMSKISTRKKHSYSTLPITSSMDIYKIIDFHFPLSYDFSEKTTVVAYDCVKKNTSQHKLDKLQIKNCNSVNVQEIESVLKFVFL